MIDRTHALPVSQQARLVGFARSSVYYRAQPVSEADQLLMRRIDELHMEFPFAGARMLARLLRREGHEIGRRRVRTLMKRMGIEALYCKPNTSRRNAQHKIWPYLLRGMKIERANQAWALDTTYIPMARGFVYLTAVVDWATRKILAYRGGHHAGSNARCRGPRGSVRALRIARNCEHGSGQPVHGECVHRSRAGPRHPAVDGWQGKLARQRVRRTGVAQHQVRRGLPEGVRVGQPRPALHRRIHRTVQPETAPFEPGGSDAG